MSGLEDHLLVMLILYRCHITQDFLDPLYGVDKAEDLPEPATDRASGPARSGCETSDPGFGGKGKFTKDEKKYNHALSRFRVRLEHAIGRMKKFRILADRYRYP